MNKAIFLDRDGVLIDDLHYNCNIDKININLKLIPILKELQSNYKLIIITNQSGVARGYFKLLDVINFNNNLVDNLNKLGVKIEEVFVCPHYVYGNVKKYSITCNCRKPNIGLILQAKEKYNIDLSQSYLIGDKKSDIECGKNANLKESFDITQMSPNEIFKKIKG